MSDQQINLFWELSEATLASPTDGTKAAEGLVAATTPDGEPTLLRRVAVDPVAMARALVLIKSFAAKHGVDPRERGEVAMFVRERDILFAADWDRGLTRTNDGQERPFRFRYSVPLARLGEGQAVWVGARIRPQDLQEAFRNRIENSDQYGVLSSDEPVWLEVLAPAGDEDGPKPQPARVLVYPTNDRRSDPREVFVLGGASLHAFEDVEPVLADAGLSALDGDALVDMAALADDAIGLCVHPWNHKAFRRHGSQPIISMPAYAVALSSRGVAISTFESPLTEKSTTGGQQVDILAPEDAEIERTPLPEGNALVDDVVLTPRFADVLGVTQGSFEEAMRVLQRTITADWELKMSAAAIAATLDGNLKLADLLREKLGTPIAAAALQEAGKGTGPARAIAATRTLQAKLEPAALAALAEALPVSKNVDIEPFRAEFEDDAALVRIATALSTGKIGEPELGRLVGDVLLTHEAKNVISRSGNARQTEVATSADLALAALRLAGKSYRTLAEESIAMVAAPASTWWEAYAKYMTALGVPSEAIDAITRTSDGKPRSDRPTARILRPPAKLREEWIAQAKVPVQGRIWKGEDGRCWAGFGHEDVGYVWFSDLPIERDPAKYPLKHDEVAKLLTRSLRSADSPHRVQWQATVHRDDLQAVVNRVVGLINPDSNVSPKALLVARWTPAELARPDGALPTKDPRFANEATRLRPLTVYLGEGASAQRFEVESGYSSENIRPPLDGTLRIYGFEPDGEALWFEVPMYNGSDSVRPEGREYGEPYAFALDADGLHDAIDFVGRRGMSSTINLLDGVVRVHDPQMRRVLFLPTVERSRVPETYRPALRAAGVPAALGEPIALADVIAQAKAFVVPVNEDPQPNELADTPAVEWRPAPDPGVQVPEEVYTTATLDPFTRQEFLLREITKLQQQLEGYVDQLPIFMAELLAPIPKQERLEKRLQKKLEELEKIQEELPAHMQIDPGVKVGEVRPGQKQRRFVTPEQVEEDEPGIVLEELESGGRAPRSR